MVASKLSNVLLMLRQQVKVMQPQCAKIAIMAITPKVKAKVTKVVGIVKVDHCA
jgi:hypothetical protein